MTAVDHRLLEAQELMHNARGILRLCGDRAFNISEVADGQHSEILSAIAGAVEVSNNILREALIIVDEVYSVMVRGSDAERRS